MIFKPFKFINNLLSLYKYKRKFLFYTRKFWNDETRIKISYRLLMGKKINLNSPKTYQEKLNWLKLNYRRDDLCLLVDKYEVKSIVNKIIGEKYIVKNYGVWNSFDDIDFDTLPNSFVLKCTHDSNSYVIVRDKNKLDKIKARKRIESHLKNNLYYNHREWPYKNCPPRVLAEELLCANDNKPIIDYKFFCFNGIPKFMYISSDTAEDARTDFFDMDFNHLEFRMKDPNADIVPEKPKRFEEMKELAKILCKGFPHVRVDFYLVNDNIYFGEMTFFHNGGFQKIYPVEWERRIGDYLTLPDKVNPYK